jgi:AraC family transcriptional regulator, L-rhamnose operon transcriptional activator RhaR
MELKQFTAYGRGGLPVWAQRASHGQHNPFEEHSHDFIELVYIVGGTGRHRINGSSYEIQTGDVFILMPGDSHHFPDAKDSGLELVNCLFRRDALTRYLPDEPGELLELSYIAPFYRPGERLPRKLSLTSMESTEVLGRLEEIVREIKAKGAGAPLLAAHLLINLLVRLSRIRMREGNAIHTAKPLSIGHEILVRNIKTHLEQHFHRKITTLELAQQFTLSERHLNRIFRQQTGLSITESLQGIRIERAKQMLSETNRSIDAIASAVGFGDPSHFHRLFLRMVGQTPSRYRKQANTSMIS